MKRSIRILLSALLVCASGLEAADSKTKPGKDSAKKQKRSSKPRAPKPKVDPNLPMVMILGDSISVGYTKFVREKLADKANIIHNPGNSQGTTHTLANVDKWLKLQDWDLIHFNLGLHDLKRVKVAGTSQNSNDPKDPYQADLSTYTANLKKIVSQLKGIGAKLIFATTTPFPAGVRPHRDPEDAANYNQAAIKIMKENNIPVNDLYNLVRSDLENLQRPKNVHFSPKGSEKMGAQVAEAIAGALK